MKNVLVVALLFIVSRTLVAQPATNAQQVEIARPVHSASAVGSKN
jgi:hypothetical protein